MPRNPYLPVANSVVFTKRRIIADLLAIDRDIAACDRILILENGFRSRTQAHIATRPIANTKLQGFNTSPFVLMIYAQSKGYSRISDIEKDILPAKLFSSMETSAGRMVEDVTLPVYGWSAVPSGMHSANSALDGKRTELPILKAATLKSGPRCLNDEMSENFADNVIAHGPGWLAAESAKELDFTYGVLYGTKKLSNKKDWHILRNIAEKLPIVNLVTPPWNQWQMRFESGGLPASATIRIGEEWWSYLGGPTCLMEICIALIRACVIPGQADPSNTRYTISDLSEIVSWPASQPTINVRIIQRSQLPWLFFLMRHFCDELV